MTGDPALATSDQLMRRLVRGDLDGVWATFSPQMRHDLGLEGLRQFWNGLGQRHGPLLSWNAVQRQRQGANEVVVLALRFQRGVMIGVVSVAAGSADLTGLFFHESPQAPAPLGPPETDGDVVNREMTFGEIPFVLGATLTGPLATVPGGAPAALLVAGSGPNDRNETVKGLTPFKDLAEGLARRGIVTLRYDKRTFRYPGDPRRITVDTEVIDDAVRAVEALRRAPGVDPDRIYLVGHSLGAFLLPEIAARAGRIVGLVMLAPPGRPLSTILLEQLRNHRYPGVEALEEQWRRSPQAPPDTLWFGAPFSYWKDLDARDEFSIARRLDLPTLLVRGNRDHNVAAIDLARWASALDPARTCVLEVPNVNHYLVVVGDNGEVTSSKASSTIIAGVADFILSPRTGCPR